MRNCGQQLLSAVFTKKSEYYFGEKSCWQKRGCTCFTNWKPRQTKKELFQKLSKKSYPHIKDDKNGLFDLYTKLSTVSTGGISELQR